MHFRKVDYASIEGRRLVADRFLDSVVIYDDDLLMNLNFKNGAKQVNIKELDAPANRSNLQSCFFHGGELEENFSSIVKQLFFLQFFDKKGIIV